MRETQISKKLFIGIAVALIILLGGAWTVWNNKLNSLPKPVVKNETSQPAAPTNKNVTYDGVEGKTALALLQQKATVVTKDSSYGPYVDSVNGVQGGTDGKYWAFYVNGTLAQVGADAYTTKTGDKIEWKFE
jgi:hypothetical protein